MYLTFEFIIPLLLALSVGLLLGWLIWGRRVGRLQEELDACAANRREVQNDLDACRAEEVKLRDRIANLTAERDDARNQAAAPATPDTPAAPSSETAARPLFERPEGEPDELQRIKGIGPFIERKLHSIGVIRFAQIARFTPDDIRRVAAAIETFQDRMHRERWMEQARLFHFEKYGSEP